MMTKNMQHFLRSLKSLSKRMFCPNGEIYSKVNVVEIIWNVSPSEAESSHLGCGQLATKWAEW